MLDLFFDRRDFLRIGSIGAGMTALGFSDEAFAAQEPSSLHDKAVVWIWLGGGLFKTISHYTKKIEKNHKFS